MIYTDVLCSLGYLIWLLCGRVGVVCTVARFSGCKDDTTVVRLACHKDYIADRWLFSIVNLSLPLRVQYVLSQSTCSNCPSISTSTSFHNSTVLWICEYFYYSCFFHRNIVAFWLFCATLWLCHSHIFSVIQLGGYLWSVSQLITMLWLLFFMVLADCRLFNAA